jgi:hypothetical protein
MSASASSSSAWPTMMVSDVTRGSGTYSRGNPTLNGAARTWPTATTSDGRASTNSTAGRSADARPRHDGDTLTDAVRLWPTASARDWKGANQAELHGENSRPLNEVAVFWSTPRASDGEKGGPNQSFGAGGVPLAAQTVKWATPSVADTTGGHSSRSGDRKGELLLNGQAKNWPTPTWLSFADSHQPGNSASMNATLDLADALFFRLDPMTYSVGGVSSHPRRSLNPLFVEWLMGWPEGWTLLGWIDFACSETALSHWKAHMRFALSQLALHDAPQAQLDLFS